MWIHKGITVALVFLFVFKTKDNNIPWQFVARHELHLQPKPSLRLFRTLNSTQLRKLGDFLVLQSQNRRLRALRRAPIPRLPFERGHHTAMHTVNWLDCPPLRDNASRFHAHARNAPSPFSFYYLFNFDCWQLAFLPAMTILPIQHFCFYQ